MLATELIETKTSNFVTKSNKLIEANYKLGVVEQKIILCLASNIRPTDSDFKTYTLPVKEFNKLLGLKGSPKYTELRKITKELMQKVFEVRINKKVIQVAWLSYVAYNESEGTIDIRFDPFLRPYLLELKKEFTSYKLENVVKLKSSYAIRIYELLKQYEKLQERTFLLDDLRKMLGAEDIYPAYGNFKQRVLMPAQKELKKKTDISFEIEEIKVGRRVNKIKFLIFPTKKKNNPQLSLFEENLEEFQLPNTFAEQVKKFGLKMGVQVSDELVKSWEKYGQENVLLLMEKVQGRTDIENPIGYITTVLNSSANNNSNKVATTSEDQTILTHLISYFRKWKEPKPDWFVKQKAIEEMQNQFDMEKNEALTKFNELKAKLFNVLEIKESEVDELSDEEFLKKKKELEKSIKGLKN
ncbi:replication initiation protein [Bacillus methanolicus]|uniref:Putative replication initiator protein n=1 Tax=Bacillus methanolicus (strain MGA3 / ATCC 53907) TaxID=796606 RepID=I3DTM9_BACMM|nr:replication initiation protein [Bacillus methanolicus]AIE61783.1 putative replication initiator protein [Bacillus methanolicus MGA3]EIJ77600.1 putative replication initiator protein [Bacillus methanolicus MGA3]